MKWRPRLSNLVRRHDGTLWTAIGLPIPLNIWAFVAVKKARIGWWVDEGGEQWVTRSPAGWDVLRP